MLFVAEASALLPVTAAGLVMIAIGQVLMGDHSVSEAQLDRRASSSDGPDKSAAAGSSTEL